MSDIWLGPNESPADVELLAHEAAHVVQQAGAHASDGLKIQRQPAPTGPGTPSSGAVAAADAAASGAGPCGVMESSLSNQGLLSQLNRARVYLTQQRRGEGEWYDYGNLLRRLSAERHRRTRSGHVWLAEPGMLQAPDELYALEAGQGLQITVRRVPGATAAGAYGESAATLVTRRQFERFLANRGVPTVNAADYFGQGDPRRPSSTTIDLPPQPRTMSVLPPAGFDPFNPRALMPEPSISPFGSSGLGPPSPWVSPPWAPRDPFGLEWGPGTLGGSPTASGSFWPRTITYTPTARETLGDLRAVPGSVSSGGPERVFLPPRSPLPPGGVLGPSPFVFPSTPVGGPVGVGSLGFLGRPGLGLPSGTTGIMWEGSHVVDVAMLNDRMYGRGFRAGFETHALDSLTGHRSRATARLNVGTPGSYANDFMFGYGGEVWGSPSHWGQGSVAIIRADGSPVHAAELIELMVRQAPGMQGGEYRFSPPVAPEPPAAGATADQLREYAARRARYDAAISAANLEAERRGLPRFCPAGGRNCINVPMDIHRQALGGADLTFTRADGTVVNLSDPAHASAATMSEFMNQPDSFFEERGLRRVRVGPQLWRGVGMAGGLGVGASLAGDAWRAAQGEDVSWGQMAFDVGVGGTSSMVGVMAEDFAYTAGTSRLVGMGLSGGTASTLSRFGAGTGVAVVLAPLTTGVEMAFDDREYTGIDYAARMGRSGVAAGGGALATGLFFAAMGSEVPLAGNVVGFLIGVGGYYLTDAIAGDDVEESIREGLGEGGCTGGVGPGR